MEKNSKKRKSIGRKTVQEIKKMKINGDDDDERSKVKPVNIRLRKA